MPTIDLSNLPFKFQPFLIGSSTCPATIKADDIKDILQREETLSTYDDAGCRILDMGHCLLKRALQTDTSGAHVYRVRKAAKIRTYIRQNNLEKYITVPEQYLYWHEQGKEFYVVAEKIALSFAVAKPVSPDIEQSFKQTIPEHVKTGQRRALALGCPQMSLTLVQAKTLAELSVLGYTNLSYDHLYFTQDNKKVAIMDTTPYKRLFKKEAQAMWAFFFLGDKGALLSWYSIAGIARLKQYTDDPDALQAVQKVERNHVLWRLGVLITKIAIVILAIYYTPTLAARIPISVIARTFKVSFIALAVLKSIVLMHDISLTYAVWHWSCQGSKGMERINHQGMHGLL